LAKELYSHWSQWAYAIPFDGEWFGSSILKLIVVERVLSICAFVRNECAVSHRAITSRGDRDWIAPHPSRGAKNKQR